MRRLITTLAVAALAIGFAGVSEAKTPPCKDASGKFMKCPPEPAPVTRCRDKTTKKFAKCSAANTEPVPAASASPAAAASPAATTSPAAAASTKPMTTPKPTTTSKPTTTPKP